MPDQYVTVEIVAGRQEAEIMKAYLNARGIKCYVSQEAAGNVYGFSIGTLGNVEIRVPSSQAKRARQAIHDYHRRKKRSPTHSS